jgi:hypothetical protein
MMTKAFQRGPESFRNSRVTAQRLSAARLAQSCHQAFVGDGSRGPDHLRLCFPRTELFQIAPTLASSFVGQSSYSFYSAIKGRALFAFEALGQVLPAALPRNAIAPSVADPNS